MIGWAPTFHSEAQIQIGGNTQHEQNAKEETGDGKYCGETAIFIARMFDGTQSGSFAVLFMWRLNSVSRFRERVHFADDSQSRMNMAIGDERCI